MNKGLPLPLPFQRGRRRRILLSLLYLLFPVPMYYSEVSRPAAAATAAATNGLAAWPMIDTRPKALVTPDALQFAADLSTHVLDDEVHPIAFL